LLGQNKKDFAYQVYLFRVARKKWRIHIINDEKAHDSIGKFSEKVEKVKNRVWGFAPCVRIQTRLRKKLHHPLPSTSCLCPNKTDTAILSEGDGDKIEVVTRGRFFFLQFCLLPFVIIG
jgi:hypothetical protein